LTPVALLEGMRRLALLTERLAARASLSADEARDAHQEIETTRHGIERLDAANKGVLEATSQAHRETKRPWMGI
jgi:hypothetical protein